MPECHEDWIENIIFLLHTKLKPDKKLNDKIRGDI